MLETKQLLPQLDAVPLEQGLGSFSKNRSEHRQSRYLGGIVTREEGLFLVRFLQQRRSGVTPLSKVRKQIERKLRQSGFWQREEHFIKSA